MSSLPLAPPRKPGLRARRTPASPSTGASTRAPAGGLSKKCRFQEGAETQARARKDLPERGFPVFAPRPASNSKGTPGCPRAVERLSSPCAPLHPPGTEELGEVLEHRFPSSSGHESDSGSLQQRQVSPGGEKPQGKGPTTAGLARDLASRWWLQLAGEWTRAGLRIPSRLPLLRRGGGP